LQQAGIINDLLDYATLKSSTVARSLSQVDVDAAVHSVVRMFRNSARTKVSRNAVNSFRDLRNSQHYQDAVITQTVKHMQLLFSARL
jgi:signal transduction histidine kinase